MGVVDSKTFQDGDRVWVELPPEFGFTGDMPIRIESNRTGVTIRPTEKPDPVEEKRKLTELIARLREIGPVGEVEVRDPDIFPDRPGL